MRKPNPDPRPLVAKLGRIIANETITVAMIACGHHFFTSLQNYHIAKGNLDEESYREAINELCAMYLQSHPFPTKDEPKH